MKSKNDNHTVMPSHIEDDCLVAFLDGETEADSHKEMRAHLESCWDCRSRLTQVERSIENFLQMRQDKLMPPALTPPGNALDLFRTRLAAHKTLTPAQSFFRSIVSNFRHLSRRIVNGLNIARYSLKTQVMLARATAAVALLGIVATFILFSGRITTVSASELLRLSIEAQNEQLHATDQPVVHQRLVIKQKFRNTRVDEPVTWEIWNDTANSRIKGASYTDGRPQNAPPAKGEVASAAGDEVVAAATITDLRSVLQANRMNEHRPLTAASYKSWSDSLAAKTEQVTKGTDSSGTDLLTITSTPGGSVAMGAITEARITFRASDYHPTELNITTKTTEGDQKFELAEQDYEVVSLRDVDPAIFADSTKLEVASTVGEKSAQPAVTAEQPASADSINTNAEPSEPNLQATIAAEVEVLGLLHKAGADISEQLSVNRTADGRLLVEGLVESDKRKSEILAALSPVSNNPAIRIRIQTIEEATKALARQKQQANQTGTGTVDRIEFGKGSLPVDNELRAFFANRGGDTDAEIRSYTSRVVNHSQSAVFQASALNRMVGRFTAAQLADLDPSARSKWIDILRGYAAAIRRETAALRGDLNPVFGGFDDGGGESIANDTDLIASSRRLYEMAEANDRIVRSAFTLSSGGASASAIKTAQFRRSLASAESLAAAIEKAR